MISTDVYERLRVLIIEDEAFTRDIIKKLLVQIGIRSIKEANEGGIGMTALLVSRPHIVLCDIHMKPTNGMDFLKNVRASKLDWVRQTKVIFLTGDSKADTVMFAKEHQIDGYLVKPVSLIQVKSRIDNIVPSINF